MKNDLYTVPEISSLQEMLIKSSLQYGEKIALEDLFTTAIPRVTFSELLDKTLRFGSALKSIGISERTHIAVISENRVQWGISYLTAMMFNLVIVPIDKNLSTNEIMNIIHESDSEAIIFSDSFKDVLLEKKSAFKKLRILISMDQLKSVNEIYSMVELIGTNNRANLDELPEIDPTKMAEIIFTSGSLGRAKGVMLSQRNLASNLMAMTSMMFIYPDDRFLSVLPIHHTYECTCGFLCPVYSGASVHYAKSLKTVAEDLKKVKATMLLAVPLLYEKMYKKILKSINEDKVKSKVVPPMVVLSNAAEKLGINIKKKLFSELHERFGGKLRVFIAGGAAPDPKVAKGLRGFGFNFVQGYGLTETSPILTLNRLDNFKDDAAGLPLPGVELKINNPGADGVGEIFAKAPSVMLGYYKNEKLTEENFEMGWFKTGDLGSIDQDGFLRISGRKKNVIISKNGENVFPEEIEDILNRSNFIMESLVYGEETGKDVTIAAQIVIDGEAFVEYSENNNIQITDELIQRLVADAVKETNKELPLFKQIKKFYIRESDFEKTTTQKIKRYLVNKNREEIVN